MYRQDSNTSWVRQSFSCHPWAMQCCGRVAVLHPLVLAWDWVMVRDGSSQKELSVILDFNDFTMIYGFAMVCPNQGVHHCWSSGEKWQFWGTGHCHFIWGRGYTRWQFKARGEHNRSVSTTTDTGFRVCLGFAWCFIDLHRITRKLHFEDSATIGILHQACSLWQETLQRSPERSGCWICWKHEGQSMWNSRGLSHVSQVRQVHQNCRTCFFVF